MEILCTLMGWGQTGPTLPILKIDLLCARENHTMMGGGLGGEGGLYMPIYTLSGPLCQRTHTRWYPCDLWLSGLFTLPFLRVSKAPVNTNKSGTKAEPVLTMNPRNIIRQSKIKTISDKIFLSQNPLLCYKNSYSQENKNNLAKKA